MDEVGNVADTDTILDPSGALLAFKVCLVADVASALCDYTTSLHGIFRCRLWPQIIVTWPKCGMAKAIMLCSRPSPPGFAYEEASRKAGQLPWGFWWLNM